jgi:phosphoglycolate phosphatase
VSLDALLLDLDGTLTDPRSGILRCIRHALEGMQRPCPGDEALVTYIGPPLRATFATLLATRETALVERAVTLYRERFAEIGLFENEVYAGIPAALAELGCAHRRLFVATAKAAVFATRIVRHFGLAGHFAGVYGPALDGRLDDKAELIAHVLVREGLARERVMMVGDRANDMTAARANGVRAIGVLWGYGSREELLAAGADTLCETPERLPAVVTDLLGGPAS